MNRDEIKFESDISNDVFYLVVRENNNGEGVQKKDWATTLE